MRAALLVAAVVVALVLCSSLAASTSRPVNVAPSAFVALSYASYCRLDVISSWRCYWCRQSIAPPVNGTEHMPSFLLRSPPALCPSPIAYHSHIIVHIDVQLVYNASEDIMAYTAVLPKTSTLVVVFRGTEVESLRDWIEDLTIGTLFLEFYL